MVGVIGFEPTAPASRTLCSTGLSHTPIIFLFHIFLVVRNKASNFLKLVIILVNCVSYTLLDIFVVIWLIS